MPLLKSSPQHKPELVHVRPVNPSNSCQEIFVGEASPRNTSLLLILKAFPLNFHAAFESTMPAQPLAVPTQSTTPHPHYQPQTHRHPTQGRLCSHVPFEKWTVILTLTPPIHLIFTFCPPGMAGYISHSGQQDGSGGGGVAGGQLSELLYASTGAQQEPRP